MGITTKELAEHCGVSRITVDRALNGRPGVGESKRQQILEAAQRLGYRPHALARSLVTGESMSLGIVIFDLLNPYFAEFTNAAERTAQMKGYTTCIMLSENDAQKERTCIEQLASRRVDGILLHTVRRDPAYIDFLKALGIPILVLMNRLSEDFPFLGVQDRRAMYDLTRYVIAKDYRRIFYVSPPLRHADTQNVYTLTERLEGHRAAMRDAGGSVQSIVLGDREYLRALGDVDDFHARKTAVMCSSDIYALELSDFFRRRGLRIPLDIGISGFDGIQYLRYFDPAITTVTLPLSALGERAVELLLHMRRGEAIADTTTLPYRISLGRSIV